MTRYMTPPDKYNKSMTNNNITGPISDSSDVKSLLDTIDQLYQVSCSVLNDHTQTSLRMAIAIEAQMLLSKLQVMNRRWKIHLPFKEASQVDFYKAYERMAEISREMAESASEDATRKYNRYCPSKHFLLDLYSVLSTEHGDRSKPYYEDTDVNRFVEQQKVMKTLVADSWEEYVTRVSDKSVTDLYARRKEKSEINIPYDAQLVQTICSNVLIELSDVLYAINQRLTSPISRKEFARLADRILIEDEYGGQFAFLKAKAKVTTWMNSTPYDRIEAECDEKIKECIADIEKTRYGGQFMQNVKIYKEFDTQRDSFGKFLFTVRDRITKDELSQLFLLVFRIYHLRHLPSQVEQDGDDDAEVQQEAPAKGGLFRPELPAEFSQNFQDNDEAVAKFFELLHKAGPYINRSKKKDDSSPGANFANWKWGHLCDALIKLKLLSSKVSFSTVSNFLHDVFPDRSEKSIYRALYRVDEETSSSIVSKVMKYFKPVTDIVNRDL